MCATVQLEVKCNTCFKQAISCEHTRPTPTSVQGRAVPLTCMGVSSHPSLVCCIAMPTTVWFVFQLVPYSGWLAWLHNVHPSSCPSCISPARTVFLGRCNRRWSPGDHANPRLQARWPLPANQKATTRWLRTVRALCCYDAGLAGNPCSMECGHGNTMQTALHPLTQLSAVLSSSDQRTTNLPGQSKCLGHEIARKV